MCGIAGIIGLQKEEARSNVDAMLDQFPYRGPNGRGVWGEERTTFGHLRLSIIDLSDAGKQPMSSHDGRFVLTFNGEIYNYIELRAELKSLGSTFLSQTDSEVIIEAYRHWGTDCVKRFNGMWAFALWDREEKMLFASRDRFGIKPFFYTWDKGILRFASEMKALLLDGKGEPHWQYLYQFFDRRMPLGSDETVFRSVVHLHPAHNLIFKAGQLHRERYWAPDPKLSQRQYDYKNSVATFRELFTDAVHLRLRSDVPLGVCLSGGIDSSVIASVIGSQVGTLQTFSSIYEEPECDESEYINAVNEHVAALPHHITPRSQDFFSVLEKIVEHHDEPVRMPGVFSHWHVMQCVQGNVTVLLDGQGADEIVGGYLDYYPSYIASLLQDVLMLRHPMAALQHLQHCLAGLDQHLGGHSTYVREALARMIPLSLRDILGRAREKEQLFSESFRKQYGKPSPSDKEEKILLNRFHSSLDREMYRTFVQTNLPMLLRYEDRNSMAFSLEARVPFLDYRLVEFCYGLSYRKKMRGFATKWILREAFCDLIPQVVSERKDKKGFPTPVAKWFRGSLKNEVRARLQNGAFLDTGLMEKKAIIHLFEDHESGVKDNSKTIFRLLSLDIWLRKYAR